MKGREMLSSDSRGAWVWDNIWAEGVKPFSPGPRQTQIGINEDITGIRYINDPFGEDARIGETDTFEQRREGLLSPGEGLLGTEQTRGPLIQTTQTPSNFTGTVPFQTTTQQVSSRGTNYGSMQTPSKKAKTSQNPSGAGRKKKPGRKKGGSAGQAGVVGTQAESYVPATYYNSVINHMSFKRANELMQEVRGKGMSKDTFQAIKKFVELVEDANLFRTNSIDIGNPMSFDVKLRYMQNGSVSEEYACKRAWKEVRNHKGSLYLYRDLAHGGNKEVVGTYKYWWDDQKDMPMIKRNYDDDRIRDLHKEWNIQESPILDKLKLGLPLSMSTEYFCSILTHNNKKYQVNLHNGRGENILKGIAIVKEGNCDDPFCSFTPEEVIT
jgi:hypothetical protein